jgi:hypothetical protein
MIAKVKKNTKTCLGCFEVKHKNKFNNHPYTRDGKRSICKSCEEEKQKIIKTKI